MPRAASSTSKEKKTATKPARAKTPAKKTSAKTTTKRTTKKETTTPKSAPTKPKRPRRPKKEHKEEVVAVGGIDQTQTTTRNASKEPDHPSPESNSKRKAPTKFANEARAKKIRRIHMAVVSIVVVAGIGSSAAVGITDAGKIDVEQTIQERNERLANMVDVEDTEVAAPTPPAVNRVPTGGLIGLQPTQQNAASTPAPTEQVAGTGTSTSATSTSNGASDGTGISATSTATTTEERGVDEQMNPPEAMEADEVDPNMTRTATTTVTASAEEVSNNE